jgi:hypothetical protein
MLWKKKTYMEWDEYQSFVHEVDDFLWRQDVREKSIANA